MPRAGLRPGQHLACITLHERREPRRIIERPGADVDETHVGLDPREQPTLAPVAMMVPRPLAVQPADHRLARGHLEAGARRHHRGRERAATHLLAAGRSEEHTSELQSLMRISYAVFCLKKKITQHDVQTPRKINKE